MPRDTVLDRFRAAASRVIALNDSWKYTEFLRREWAVGDRQPTLFDDALERLRETLKEAEEIG